MRQSERLSSDTHTHTHTHRERERERERERLYEERVWVTLMTSNE